MERALNGYVLRGHDGGKRFERTHFDNPLALSMLERLDRRRAESARADHVVHQIAQEFHEFVEIVRSQGDAAAFLTEREALSDEERGERGILERLRDFSLGRRRRQDGGAN